MLFNEVVWTLNLFQAALNIFQFSSPSPRAIMHRLFPFYLPLAYWSHVTGFCMYKWNIWHLKGHCSSSSFLSSVLGESCYLCWPLWGHRRPQWHNWFCSVSWFTTYKPLMTRIWWLVPFVLQWDGKLCRATYLRSNSPLITLQPRRGAFCSSTSATLTTSTRK